MPMPPEVRAARAPWRPDPGRPTVPSQPPPELPARDMAAAKFTRKEVEARNHRKDAAIIIDNVVYDVTPFLDDHPGGVEVLLDNAGKDASQCFHDVGHSDIALEWREKFVAGEVVDEDRWEVRARDAAPAHEAEPLTLGALLSVWGPPLALAGLAALLYMYVFP